MADLGLTGGGGGRQLPGGLRDTEDLPRKNVDKIVLVKYFLKAVYTSCFTTVFQILHPVV